MKLINYHAEVIPQTNLLKHVEYAGRTAYLSYPKITENSVLEFIQMIRNRNHGTVLEHGTVYLVGNALITDVSKVSQVYKPIFSELRILRKNEYTKRNVINGNEYITTNQFLKFEESVQDWLECCEFIEKKYMRMVACGEEPQITRQILMLSTKTEVVYTAYLSDWRHFFELRTAGAAHPIMRHIVIPLKEQFKQTGLL
jgi:thymidylate synthase (FAD)